MEFRYWIGNRWYQMIWLQPRRLDLTMRWFGISLAWGARIPWLPAGLRYWGAGVKWKRNPKATESGLLFLETAHFGNIKLSTGEQRWQRWRTTVG
jgi:hypothetical protein